MTTAPTNNQIDQLLAEKVMGWTLVGGEWCSSSPDGSKLVYYHDDYDEEFSPTTNFNHLRDVLRRLTPEQRQRVVVDLLPTGSKRDYEITTGCSSYVDNRISGVRVSDFIYVLTCDPAIIARAVAEVVK